MLPPGREIKNNYDFQYLCQKNLNLAIKLLCHMSPSTDKIALPQPNPTQPYPNPYPNQTLTKFGLG